MTAVRIAALALNQTPLAWDDNRENIIAAIAAARAQGAHIVCMPELCITGYGCEDAFLWGNTAELALRVLEEILPHTDGLIVSLGLPLWVEGRLYNTAALLSAGRIIGFACKRHLARDGIHYEPRWFSAWPPGRQVQMAVLGQSVPVGDYVFEVGGVRIGYEICEDAWVAERPALEMERHDVDLILNPSASHFSFFKHLRRRQLVHDGATRVRAGYIYCNLLGNEAGRAIYDGDCLISTGGMGATVLAESRRFSFAPFQMAVATLDVPERDRADSLRLHSPQLLRPTITAHYGYPEPSDNEVISGNTPGELQPGHLPKEQALARALPLGLFDYMRKSRSTGFVVSLSGGADSAAVSLMVRLMVRLAWEELGPHQTTERLNLPPAASEMELMKRVLCTVYQGTRNSSEVTRSAAAVLAQALGAEHHEIFVDTLVDEYVRLTESMMGRPLSWERDDMALQNIQARCRAPSVWMLANVRRALLLSTSNRSEAAVGYATMDGDTAGGLSPIAGIDKAYLRKWLLYMERYGLDEMPPLAELDAINSQQPTAELRPPSEGQTDEADLMPYEVLDVIERAAVVERIAPELVLERVIAQFNCGREQALAWVTKFYRMFAVNQWKRERYAPSFHADDGNLDPKTWCRFPILSGAFERELRELKTKN